MPDYRRKAELIKDGKMIAEVKKMNRAEYAHCAIYLTGELIEPEIDLETLFLKRYELGNNPDYIEAGRIVHAQSNRTTRLRSRIEDIITSSPESTFCTLTFTDEYLASTSALTRRRYVTRYLKEQSAGGSYVANIDFGARNGREHYHAVCGFRLNPKDWECGALNVQLIRVGSKPIKLAKYVSKLTNHAIKETCKRNAIIYSRTGSVFNDQ